MKKHIIQNWLEDNKNPFLVSLPVLEAPVSEPLPQEIPPQDQMPGIQNTPGSDPNTPEFGDNPPNSDSSQAQGIGPEQDGPADQQVPQDQGMESNPDFDQEMTGPEVDFETEKIDYLNLAVKMKFDDMTDKLMEMRDLEGLKAGQYKFIEDNLQILSLGRDSSFAEVRKKVYKRIKDTFENLISAEPKTDVDLDMGQQDENPPESRVPSQNQQEPIPTPSPESPVPPTESYNYGQNLKAILLKEQDELGKLSGTEVFSIISEEIEKNEDIKETLLKLPSLYALKADLYRKIICACCNGVQVGSGGSLEDVFIPIGPDGIGIKLCTRCYASWGNIEIGKWMIQFNDPENFLSESELDKLNNDGSPEEKEVLRKRVVIESIGAKFKDRIFLILMVNPEDGMRTEIGFNFSEFLRSAWKDGLVTVHFKPNIGTGDAAIQIDGTLIDIQGITLDFVKTNPEEMDQDGAPSKKMIKFMEQKDGNIYIVIDAENFRELTQSSQSGVFYEEKTSELDRDTLLKVQRCVPGVKEIILKKC